MGSVSVENDKGNCSGISGSSSRGVWASGLEGVLLFPVILASDIVEVDGFPGGVAGSKIGGKKDRLVGGSKMLGEAGEIGVRSCDGEIGCS